MEWSSSPLKANSESEVDRSPGLRLADSISTKSGRCERLKCRVRHKGRIVRVHFEQPYTPITEVLEQFPVFDSVHLPRPDNARPVDVRFVVDPLIVSHMSGAVPDDDEVSSTVLRQLRQQLSSSQRPARFEAPYRQSK